MPRQPSKKGPESEATELLSASERDRLLRAVAELCTEQGYEETTVEDVIERAGVSSETFDNLFQDKEDCAVAAVDAILSEVMAAVSANYSADRPEWDSYLLAIKAMLELLGAYPSFSYLSLVCARQMAPRRLAEGREAGLRLLAALLERLWDYSSSEVKPTNAAYAALGGAEAVIRREIVAGRADQLPRFLPDFIYVAIVPFLGQEEALRLARRARELLAGSEWG